MTTHNLEGFFAPSSIVVVGPSRHAPEISDHLLQQLSDYATLHPLSIIDLPVENPGNYTVAETLSDLKQPPDLAICLGTPGGLPATIAQLAKAGTRAVLLLSPGFESWPGDMLQACREAARAAKLRLIGPGSLGIAVPTLSLNALLSAEAPAKGDIAFIARSGAILNSTLTWAANRETGFSAVVSLGDRMDVDIGDLIDYFAQDYRTRAILLHVEGVSEPRKFVSATRAAARSKPVIVIRSGRSRDPGGTGQTHAGRLADVDLVYEAAFRRTGMLRVADLDEMFEAVETLSRVRVPKCEALAIVANGRSLANLAADRLADLGGTMATLNTGTLTELKSLCRATLPPSDILNANEPFVLLENLPANSIEKALKAILADPAVDGVLALHSASTFAGLQTIGKTIAKTAKEDKQRTGRRKALVAGLIGGSISARADLDAAKIPCYASPAEAVRSMMHLARDARARDFLMDVPPSLPSDFTPNAKTARAIVEKALSEDRTWLAPEEVASVLTAYQIPIIGTQLAANPADAAAISEEFFKTSRHCVVKLISPDLPFKSRIDGLRLGLESPSAVEAAASKLISQTLHMHPAARISGVSVHPMLEDRQGLELFLGLADTPVFGPVIVFGHGGTAVEDNADISMELAPLDLKLAGALINRTRVNRLLAGGRARPALDRDAVALALVKLSQITIDIPEILELDINPLIAREADVLALDARIALGRPKRHPGRHGQSRLAIAPYPKEWEQTLHVKNGRDVFVRPVRPEDEELFKTFFEAISPEDLRLRFFAPVRDFNRRFLARLTQLDYARAMAFAALDTITGELQGVVRLHADPDHRTGEYAIMVRSDLKGIGLGWALMKLIVHYAKADGLQTIKGEVLKENTSMLDMCRALGFSVKTSHEDPGIADVTLPVSTLDHTIEC